MKISSSLLKNQFNFFIALSFFVHICLFLFLIFTPGQFVSKKIQIKQVMRVDMVGLPDIQRTKSVKKKQVQKPKPKPLPQIKKKKAKPQKTKKKVKKKQDKTKEKQPTKQSVQEQTKQKQEEALEKLKNETKPSYKGEKLSKGDSADGEVDSLLLYGYFARVRSHVKMFWNLPRILADKNLKATVIIEINKRGEVTRIELENTSGNEAFDQIVIETIRNASPVPEPPVELTSLLKQGVGFNFP